MNDSFHAGMVALVGLPNVGKSTLMNKVLGVKIAIATSKPQTTRNRILGVRTWETGQICFVDTPGIHQSKKRLNRAMVQVAVNALEEVDLVVHILDAAALSGADARGDLDAAWHDEEQVFGLLDSIEAPRIVVLNKVDKVDPKARLLPLMAMIGERAPQVEIIPVSALTGDNVDQLVELLLAKLPAQEALFPEDTLTDQAELFVAAEFVREQIMEQTRKEVPYSVAVEVERFHERDNVIEISAVIHVERDSQKGIIIGDGGARIKTIGTNARAELEKFFGKKVFLETFVRVESEWSENPRALHRFGYEE